jgi:esterase/lipase superfamily enzyme
VNCVLLENRFDLRLAQSIAERFSFIIGINGRFADNFVGDFYPRIVTDGLYYETFAEAQWTFSHGSQTGSANVEQCPYFITRDMMGVEAGYARRFGAVSGLAVAGALFEPYEPDDHAIKYSLFYGTNRRPNAPDDPSKSFSSERDERLHLGVCTVVVPKSHQIGSLGTAWWKRLLTRRRKDCPLVLDWSTIRQLSADSYWAKIRSSSRKEASNVLYIHGYNVSFELAALRAAQLGVDLKIDGVMAFFSWPSKGQFTEYMADEATIEISEKPLAEYLQNLVTSIGNRRLNVIAHSMGNRALLRSLHQLLSRVADQTGIQFGQIFLAAPDVDAGLFRNLADVYKRVSLRTTMYVSAKDKALASSGYLHDYPRAGFTPPVTVISGIDTVEATNIDLSFLGHGYFADARPVLNDIFHLIQHDTPPDKRFSLNARARRHDVEGDLCYWAFSS